MSQSRWAGGLAVLAAILLSAVFLLAGLWKITDPLGAAVRLAQLKVPQPVSVFTAIALGSIETFTGVLLLAQRWRRWGAWIATVLLVIFMAFIAINYEELRGADCSCFPWLKRAVGPWFFAGDGAMLLLALGAGFRSRTVAGMRSAGLLLGVIAAFAVISYGFAAGRNTGTKAPGTITTEEGRPVSLSEGKVFIYFFDPQCLHCLEAGRRLAALNWGNTRFIGVPTENPELGAWFMGKAGLSGKGIISRDLAALKTAFPFESTPAGVAVENGYGKAMLRQFEEGEPAATLRRIGFAK